MKTYAENLVRWMCLLNILDLVRKNGCEETEIRSMKMIALGFSEKIDVDFDMENNDFNDGEFIREIGFCNGTNETVKVYIRKGNVCLDEDSVNACRPFGHERLCESC